MYNEILNELHFNDNIDFKAGVIKVNSFYEITTSKLLIFISSFVLSIIASLLLVLIRILRFWRPENILTTVFCNRVECGK